MASASGEVIAIEEHYWDAELERAGVNRSGPITERLLDPGELRIREMDEAGIDIQIISHAGGGAQDLDPAVGVAMARRANDRLAKFIAEHPTRLRGFAALPTTAPEAAADELERCVRDLGFVGAMFTGLSRGEFLDKKKFWPIYARAEALDVPISLHPGTPHPAVEKAYYEDYTGEFPSVASAALAYTIEGHVQAVRFVLSRVFETHPRLKIILGHFGEGVPFSLLRIDRTLGRGKSPIDFRAVFARHFYVSTSGFFSDPALLCTMLEMSTDHILFAVDWPWGNNRQGLEWFEGTSLSRVDKAKILSGNARKLLKLA